MLLSFVIALALARADGIAAVDCQACHAGTNAVTTTLEASPAQPALGQTVTLTLTVRGPGRVAGMYVRSNRVGTFTNLSNATKLVGGEPVHSAPLAAANGAVTFQVAYRATNSLGGADLEAFTVMANDNRAAGDDTPSFASLSLGWGCDAGTWYRDFDGDGIGDALSGVSHVCGLGFGWSDRSDDCDDRRPGVRPGAVETCNGRDDDCDGQTDEGLELEATWPDLDDDGFGAADAGMLTGCAARRSSNALDCNDAELFVNPGAVERCNGRDDDCDGVVDGSGCQPTCTPKSETCNGLDDDCDGVVDTPLCKPKPACVPTAELCNGKDDDCDASIDEDCPSCGCELGGGGGSGLLLVLLCAAWRKTRAARSP